MVVNSGQDLIRQPGRGSVLFTALLGLSLAVLRGAFLLKASLRYLLQRSFLHALSGPVPFLFGGGGSLWHSAVEPMGLGSGSQSQARVSALSQVTQSLEP